jgi:hypothetical protein
VAATAAVAGCALALLTGFAAGGIGSGALSGIGARWWAVGSCGFLLVLVSSSAWLAVDLLWAGQVVTEPVRARLRAVAGPAASGAAASGTAASGPAAKPVADSRTTAASRTTAGKAEDSETRSRNAG